MTESILKSLLSLHSKIDDVASDQKDLVDKFNDMPCKVNNNRLQMLEKVVYGAVKVILVAFVLSVAALTMYKGSDKAVANTKQVIKKEHIHAKK